jgi:hypothetical protein
MEPYPVDVEAKQIVRWLIDEERRRAFDLMVTASRSYQANGLARDDLRFGDLEREELSEISEIGFLEVLPRREPRRWVLRIRVEDDIGPHLPEDESSAPDDEEIDVLTFYEEFFAADRGLAETSAEVDGPQAKAALTRLLGAILNNATRGD